MQTIDLKGIEEWREYDFPSRVYRIDAPAKLEYREGGTTHRVTDGEGIVHLVPAPGHLGCVVRFKGAVIA